ncbi:hypothetical protein C2S51_015445 [Perilla frutescens var. frutescens]|nr:hypothetical protein C2S51_015445 [Perilla frutescens var. frutescens]
MHDSFYGGYSRFNGAYMRLKGVFFWLGIKENMEKLVRSCDVCKLSRPDNGPTQELMQPLPIPELQWSHICKDFAEGLPKCGGTNTNQVEETFLKVCGVFQMNDPCLVSPPLLLQPLLTSDPQLDGQIEDWYNTNYHYAFKLTFFQALYGHNPSYSAMNPYVDTNRCTVMRGCVPFEQMLALWGGEGENITMGGEVTIKNGEWIAEKEGARVKTPFVGHNQLQLEIGDWVTVKKIYHISYKSEFIPKKNLSAREVKIPELPEIVDEGLSRIVPVSLLDTRTMLRVREGIALLLMQWEGEKSGLISHEDEEFVKKKSTAFGSCSQGLRIRESMSRSKMVEDEVEGEESFNLVSCEEDQSDEVLGGIITEEKEDGWILGSILITGEVLEQEVAGKKGDEEWIGEMKPKT